MKEDAGAHRYLHSSVSGPWQKKPSADLSLDKGPAIKALQDDLKVHSGSCWVKSPERGLNTNNRIKINTDFQRKSESEGQNGDNVFPHSKPSKKKPDCSFFFF